LFVCLGSPNRFSRITRNYQRMLSLSSTSFNAYLAVFKERFNIDTTSFAAENFIDNIQVPILLIHDKTDSVVPFQDALQITAKHPEIKFITTENLGHSLYHPSVYKSIIAFIQQENN